MENFISDVLMPVIECFLTKLAEWLVGRFGQTALALS